MPFGVHFALYFWIPCSPLSKVHRVPAAAGLVGGVARLHLLQRPRARLAAVLRVGRDAPRAVADPVAGAGAVAPVGPVGEAAVHHVGVARLLVALLELLLVAGEALAGGRRGLLVAVRFFPGEGFLLSAIGLFFQG